MSGSSKDTNTTAQTTQDPWAATIPALNNVLGQVSNQTANTSTTPTEYGALSSLMANAQAGNPYAPAINGLASNLLAGGGPDRSGYTTQGLSQLQSSLNPIANQSTNPYDNQAFNQLRGTLTNDITDQIKSQYAGAGYGSGVTTGDFGQQLGRGISQGIAPAFVDAQNNLTNQRMGAGNALYQGGAQTSGILSGLDQTRLGNQLQGVQTSTDALNANDSPFMRQLQISQQQRQLPLQNIGNVQSLLLPMAQLGGTTNATQQSHTTSNPGLLGTLQGIFGGGASSLFSGMGGPGLAGWLGSKLG